MPNVGGAGFAQGWLQAKVVKVFVNGTLVFFSTHIKKRIHDLKKKMHFQTKRFLFVISHKVVRSNWERWMDLFTERVVVPLGRAPQRGLNMISSF